MASVHKSSAYIIAGTFSSKAIAFVGSIFIARILFPEDFGYILFAQIISGFIMLVTNCGFENFYLQEEMVNDEYEAEVLGVTYKLRLAFSTVLSLFQVGISYVMQYAFDEEIIGTILRVSALGHLFNGLTIGRQYILRKRLDFRVESIGIVVRDAFSSVAKVGFALLGLGAVSIPMGAVVGSIARMFVYLSVCRAVPMAKNWNQKIAKRVWHFGIYSFLSNIGMYFSNYIDKMLLTTTFSKADMGFYSFAFSRADMVKGYTTRPFVNLVIAWIAKNKANKKKIVGKIAKLTYLQTAILSPVILFLMVFADWLIPLIFGDRWVDAVPLFRVFLVVQLLSCLTEYISTALTGFGFPKRTSHLVWAKLVVLGITLPVVVQANNLIIYASFFSFVFIVFAFIKAYMCLNILESRFMEYFREMKLGVVTIWSGVYVINMLAFRVTMGSGTQSAISAGVALSVLMLINHLYFSRTYTRSVLEMILPKRFAWVLDYFN